MLRVKARPRAQTRLDLASFTAEDAFFSFSRSTCEITEFSFCSRLAGKFRPAHAQRARGGIVTAAVNAAPSRRENGAFTAANTTTPAARYDLLMATDEVCSNARHPCPSDWHDIRE